MKTKITISSVFLFLITNLCFGTIYSVTNTNDAGNGSLRQAIINANNNVGADEISFNIPGLPTHTIILSSNLPQIYESLNIDGNTQPNNGFTGTMPKIEINCNNFIGLQAQSFSTIKIKALSIKNSSSAGIIINYNNLNVNSNVEIIDNVIFSNIGDGIMSFSYGSVYIKGNKIGTDYTGNLEFGNGSSGLNLWYGNYFIGEDNLLERNIISGNASWGVNIVEGSATIRGNIVGINSDGTNALPNQTGIRIERATGMIYNNVVSGNLAGGIYVRDSISHVIIKGNKIGTDITGTVGIPNLSTEAGIKIFHCDNNIIGGILPGEGNVIGSNTGGGIRLEQSSNNVIYGNCIGTDLSGQINLGNGVGGIMLRGFGFTWLTNNNKIGGENIGESNIIAFNQGSGVFVNYSNFQVDNNLISRNVFYQNTYQAIRLNNNANQNIQKPIITNSSQNLVEGTSLPNAKIELYYHDSLSSSPHGKIFINTVVSDVNGNWSYAGTLTNTMITATVTDSLNNTSEFSLIDTVDLCQAISVTQTLYICNGEIIIVGNNSYNLSGLYTDSLVMVNGCDSIVVTNLIVNPVFEIFIDTIINVGDSIIVGNNVYYTDGLYTDSLISLFGCDSVIMTTINLVGKISEAQYANVNVKVIPNPVIDDALIEIDGIEAGCVLKIIDLNGNIIEEITISQEKMILKGGVLKKGIYFYNLIDNKKRVLSTGKLIIV